MLCCPLLSFSICTGGIGSFRFGNSLGKAAEARASRGRSLREELSPLSMAALMGEGKTQEWDLGHAAHLPKGQAAAHAKWPHCSWLCCCYFCWLRMLVFNCICKHCTATLFGIVENISYAHLAHTSEATSLKNKVKEKKKLNY